MHILQPKHVRMKPEEVKKLIETLNISVAQLPRIKATDPSLPEGCERGEVVRIEREHGGKKREYYRVVV